MYVYIDESGNLGFSSKSTHFFVVAYLLLEDPSYVNNKMRRMLKRFHKNQQYARGYNELKFSQSRDYIRRKVLEGICRCDPEIGYVVLEKAKVKTSLRKNRNILYNFVIIDKIMRNILPKCSSTEILNVTVDRSLPRSSREAFNNYAKSKASWLLTVEWGQSDHIMISNIKVRHENSQREPCLQSADFLAGACFHKYERNNDCYYRIIENKVKYLNYLW